MKTPIQEAIETIKEYRNGGCADVDTCNTILLQLASMLEKEQQVMCEFAIDYTMQAKTAYDFHRAKFNNEL